MRIIFHPLSLEENDRIVRRFMSYGIHYQCGSKCLDMHTYKARSDGWTSFPYLVFDVDSGGITGTRNNRDGVIAETEDEFIGMILKARREMGLRSGNNFEASLDF